MEKLKKTVTRKAGEIGKEIGLMEAIEAMLPLETEIQLVDPKLKLQIKVMKVKLDKKDSYFAILAREVK